MSKDEIGIFDVIGPNMTGPSSSHTAGALRIAFIAGRMVRQITSVHFILYGSFAKTYRGHGTDRALVAGILGFHPDDPGIRDSFSFAEDMGLEYSFEENDTDIDIYPNTVDIIIRGKCGEEMSVRGESVGGGNVLITRVNGVDVELSGSYCTLLVEHEDRKGTLAFITAVLSEYDLNIASLRLFRENKGDTAYAVIETDSETGEEALKAIEDYETVRNVIMVPAIEA